MLDPNDRVLATAVWTREHPYWREYVFPPLSLHDAMFECRGMGDQGALTRCARCPRFTAPLYRHCDPCRTALLDDVAAPVPYTGRECTAADATGAA